MATPVIKHTHLTGAAANPNVLVDGPKWDEAHTVTGLENVDNTSDANKPVSTAQAAADAVVAAAAANASNLTSGTVAAARMPALTGDVTTSAGAVAATIANNAVTNAKAAQMAANTIKGNNTGSTANAADLTVAQITALLASGKPTFKASLTSGSQTPAAGTWTKINLNSKEWDTDSFFDATTNFRFQPTISGYYIFTAQVDANAAASGGKAGAGFAKNGALVVNALSVISSGTATDNAIFGSAIFFLNGSTDYIELWGYSTGASPTFFNNACAMSGVLVR